MNFILAVYTAVLFLGLMVYIPVSFLRKRMNCEGFFQKSTFYSARLCRNLKAGRRPVWIHAVSVGEIALVKALVRQLQTVSGQEIVISTTTLAGKIMANRLYPDLQCLYLPFDLPWLVKRMLRLCLPAVFVSVETEIWPNLYRQLNRQKVPLIILNGRISDQAFARYRTVRPLIKEVFGHIDFVGAQSQRYRQRFLQLGLEESKCRVTGNLKYAGLEADEKELERFRAEYKSLTGTDQFLFIAASTHSPEEEMICKVYAGLKNKFPALRLLIAPRHIEKIPVLEKLCRNQGLAVCRVSCLDQDTDRKSVLLLDSVGDLFFFYSLAEICFVGGSLVDRGGHNILEPLYFSLPTLFGPYMSNFQEIKDHVLECRAAIQVADEKELGEKIEQLAGQKVLRKEYADRAEQLFREGRRILETNVSLITKWLR